MKRFILLLMLIAAFSFSNESKACITLPNNSLTVSGPTAVCASNSDASYTLSYSAGIDDPYVLYFAVQGGNVTNIQPFTSLGGVINGEGCVPILVSSFIHGCGVDQVYNIAPSCRGGINFDVEWDNECFTFDGGQILADMTSTAGTFSDPLYVSIDPSCIGNPQDEDVFNSIGGQAGNTVDFTIYPNPAIGSSAVISLPSDFDDYEVRVTDINGRLINQFFEASGRLSLNTTDMHGGVYFVQVIASDGTMETRKLLISK